VVSSAVVICISSTTYVIYSQYSEFLYIYMCTEKLYDVRVEDLLDKVCILCHRVYRLHSFNISVMYRILVDAVLG